jgi:hypothetical protein
VKTFDVSEETIGLNAGKTIPFCGFYFFLLLVFRIYQCRIFEVIEFKEDLKQELKRTKSILKTNPYVNDYLRKILDPEYGISYVKQILNLLIIHLFFDFVYFGIEAVFIILYFVRQLQWC